MISREYEQYQLKLIGKSYLERGFTVLYNASINGLSYRFDALAQNESDEIIIIELVNKSQSNDAMKERLKALEEISNLIPRAKVDFRYIDVDAGSFQMIRRLAQEPRELDLQQALTVRLPRLAGQEEDATLLFLNLWLLHVATIRAYGASLRLNQANSKSLLDLYNEMLQSKDLIAPEVLADSVSQDLFDLYAKAQGAIQGALIGRDTYEQLRGHVREIRKQIRKQQP